MLQCQKCAWSRTPIKVTLSNHCDWCLKTSQQTFAVRYGVSVYNYLATTRSQGTMVKEEKLWVTDHSFTLLQNMYSQAMSQTPKESHYQQSPDNAPHHHTHILHMHTWAISAFHYANLDKIIGEAIFIIPIWRAFLLQLACKDIGIVYLP